MILVHIFVFSTVTLAVLWCWEKVTGGFRSTPGLGLAVGDFNVSKEPPWIFRVLAPGIGLFKPLIADQVAKGSPYRQQRLERNLVASGIPLTAGDIRGMQGTLAFFIFTMTFLAFIQVHSDEFGPRIIAGGGILLIMGWMLPSNWVERVAESRRAKTSRMLPYALDLISSSMEAGLDFAEAVRIYVHEGPKGPLREELGRTLNEITMNKPRVEAMQDLAGRMSMPELQQLASALSIGDELGARIAGTLKIQAKELRRLRQHRIDRQAERAPSLMLFPMAVFIMPSVFVIIATPVFIRMQGSGLGQLMNLSP